MIRSDPIQFIGPEIRAQLSPYALDEIEKGGEYFEELVRKSDTIHVVMYDERLIAVVGVARRTFLGTAHFWFLLSGDMKLGDLRALKKITPKLFEYFPRVETGVEIGYRTGERFAKFFGFQPFGEPYSVFDRTFQQYEARG